MNTAAAAASALKLEDQSFTPSPGISSNRFASGCNPNAGNVLTERPTTRLHQAPGGNSSISLVDVSGSPAVGVAVKRVRPSMNNARQPPGGASSFSLGDAKFQGKDVCDENTNKANLQNALQNVVKITQAPGGTAAIVLG